MSVSDAGPHDPPGASGPVVVLGLAALLMCGLGGCAVVSVASAAVTVGATVVKTAAKVTGKVVETAADVVLPDSAPPAKP